MRRAVKSTEPVSYDPVGPLRSPLSKRSIAEATSDMASVIARYARSSADGTVTRDDLHRAGFSNGEIEACHGNAVAQATERLAPRQIAPDAATER